VLFSILFAIIWSFFLLPPPTPWKFFCRRPWVVADCDVWRLNLELLLPKPPRAWWADSERRKWCFGFTPLSFWSTVDIIGAGSGGAAAPPGDILAPLDDFFPPQTCILGHFWDKNASNPVKMFFLFCLIRERLILGQKHSEPGEDLIFF